MPEFLAIHTSDAQLLGCALRTAAARVQLARRISRGRSGLLPVGRRADAQAAAGRQPAGGARAARRGSRERGGDHLRGRAQAAVARAARTTSRATFPFRFRRWLVAFAGEPDGLAPARAALLTAVPDFLRRAARGDSAAEALVLLFLSRLAIWAGLRHPNLEAEPAARALAAAASETPSARSTSQGGPAAPAGLAIAASNGRAPSTSGLAPRTSALDARARRHPALRPARGLPADEPAPSLRPLAPRLASAAAPLRRRHLRQPRRGGLRARPRGRPRGHRPRPRRPHRLNPRSRT